MWHPASYVVRNRNLTRKAGFTQQNGQIGQRLINPKPIVRISPARKLRICKEAGMVTFLPQMVGGSFACSFGCRVPVNAINVQTPKTIDMKYASHAQTKKVTACAGTF